MIGQFQTFFLVGKSRAEISSVSPKNHGNTSNILKLYLLFATTLLGKKNLLNFFLIFYFILRSFVITCQKRSSSLTGGYNRVSFMFSIFFTPRILVEIIRRQIQHVNSKMRVKWGKIEFVALVIFLTAVFWNVKFSSHVDGFSFLP